MLHKGILSRIRFLEPMSRHTTFKIGGPCDIWAVPEDINDLIEIIELCKQDNMEVLVAGRGSNLLVKDGGWAGTVLNLRTGGFRKISYEYDTVTAGAGTDIAELLRFLCKKGLIGLEFLAGIPATVGGAVVMNAGGVYKNQKSKIKNQICQIGDFVQEVTALDKNDKVVTLARKELFFGYRTTNLTDCIVLSVKLKLKKSNNTEAASRIRHFLKEKQKNQELNRPSAGCIFKNPDGRSAGRMIDVSGLKGKRVGDAMVSTKHANFIVNMGKAKCDDVMRLMDMIREKVKQDHGILLEPEVKIIG